MPVLANNIDPKYRTDLVVALCYSMLSSRDFTPTPILADALQDAGCPDTHLLSVLRGEERDEYYRPLDKIGAERLVNLIYSDETADAVRWMEQFIRNINYHDDGDAEDDPGYPHRYSSGITAGHNGITDDSHCWGTDDAAEFFYSDDNKKEFYRNWCLITGKPEPSDEKLETIRFRCAC